MCIIYRFLTYIIYPFLYLYYKYKNAPADFMRESFVAYSENPFTLSPDKKVIWIHGVSMGETLTAINFSRFLVEKGFEVFFTTKTQSAYQTLKSKKLNAVYIPFDLPFLIRRFLSIFSPAMVMFFESEIWPNTIFEIKKANIPLYLINARISQKSFDRWKLLRRTFRKLLNRFDLIITQSPSDSTRFKYFSQNNIIYVGNLKFASEKIESIEKYSPRLMIIAASTHSGEEEIVLEAYKKLTELFNKNIVLVLVPRHIERTKTEVVPLIKKFGLKYQLHSESKKINDSTDVYAVDTFGELNKFYEKSEIAFVGGSLVKNIGGHNIFEPAIRKNVVIYGPFMANQLDMKILFKDCSKEVSNAEELYNTLKQFICDRDLIKQFSENAYKIAESSNKHVIEEAMQLINKNYFK